jgi:hypothetical protein
MRTTTDRTLSIPLAVVAAVAVAALLLAGCTSSTGPELTPQPDVHYFARTTPDSVVANLRLAYEDRHLDQYLDCLAESFAFYPSERTLEENEWIPDSWGKTEEYQIHRRMFGPYGFVSSVALALLQEGEAVEIPGPQPEDPVTYEYTFGVNLRVDCPDSVQYVATAPVLFVLQIDPDELSETGESLWEIIVWFDLDDDKDCGRPVMPTSWGELKAMFLDID